MDLTHSSSFLGRHTERKPPAARCPLEPHRRYSLGARPTMSQSPPLDLVIGVNVEVILTRPCIFCMDNH
jgi:hypothetical protein